MKWRSLEESVSAPAPQSLAETYAERKTLIAKYVPRDIQAVHERVVEELKKSGIADRTLSVASPVSEFELPDQNGNVVRSSEFLQRGPLVVCFFRGRWCPFCVGQMEALNAVYPKIRSLNAELVGISPQTVHQSFLMADQHKLQFPLLSDKGNSVARKFGLVYRVPEYQQEIYSRAFVNLPFVNGDSSWELPIPATLVLQANTNDRPPINSPNSRPVSSAKVIYASANPDYTDRPEPGEIVEFLAQLSS